MVSLGHNDEIRVETMSKEYDSTKYNFLSTLPKLQIKLTGTLQ